MRPSKKKLLALTGVGILVLIAGILYFSLRPDSSMQPNIQEGMPRYRAGEFEIAVATEPETPKVGDNRLIVEVYDRDGNPLPGLAMDAYGEMPAMGSMPVTRAPADLKETAAGRFEGEMNLSMRGEWPLTIQFKTAQGDPVRLQFDLATDRKGLSIAGGGTAVTNTGEAPVPTGDDGMPRYRAGELEVAIDIEPRKAQVGENRLLIEVRDAGGNPVTDVKINSYAEMPAMGAMPTMRAPVDLEEVAPGRFEGEMNLSMRGEWPLTVHIEEPKGGKQRLQFDLATDREGLTIAAGGSPIGGPAMAADDINAIKIDNRRRQLIGVETGEATHRDLVRNIRAVGKVSYDERLLSHITLKFDGYIGELKADYVGTPIEKGQVLFTVYSPELLAAQQEYLQTFQRRGNFSGSGTLLQAARQRLALWDLSSAEIEALERRGAPQPYVAIRAPRSGTLIQRNITAGGVARMGDTLLTIADLSQVWVEAQIFEADLELVKAGMNAVVTLPYLPGKEYPARVEYVYPYLEGDSRTGRIRLTLDNAPGALKPDMYAEVSLKAELGHRLSVPEEAVIIAGETRVVFVDLGDGRLKPTRIKTGRSAEGFIVVQEGLSLGDKVVTSGNFLISAETRLKTGIQQW
jgi:Cu(I)/Ag(I) efflux system membrane fusion protein